MTEKIKEKFDKATRLALFEAIERKKAVIDCFLFCFLVMQL